MKVKVIVAALALAALHSPVQAQLAGQFGILDVEANGGINPNTGVAWAEGDQYRLAFHTAGKIDALANGLDAYNAFATAQANGSALGNGAITTSTGWQAMITVNLDATMTEAAGPKNDIFASTGTEHAGDSAIGGAGFPVYAMDGATCIARNNADIWNNWSNPFNGDATLRLASGSINNDSDGNPVTASQNVNYSPFLDQHGLGDSANIHGPDVWTGSQGSGSLTNALGATVGGVGDEDVRAAHGNANANNAGRIRNRFNRNLTDAKSLYVLSEPLTVTTGGGAAPFDITEYVVDEGAGTVELTWNSKAGKVYIVRYSFDLLTWPGDVDDGAAHDADGNGDEFTTITLTIADTALNGQTRWFLRVEELEE